MKVKPNTKLAKRSKIQKHKLIVILRQYKKFENNIMQLNNCIQINQLLKL